MIQNNKKIKNSIYHGGSVLSLKSLNGRRCLSQCHPKGETYLHPILLTDITTHVNSCAIDPIYSKEAQYQGMQLADACKLEDNKIYKPPDEMESMLLTYYFNPYDFLTTIYNLNTFDEVIYWTLEHDYLPFDTIKRVHNCAWKVYGNKMEEISGNVIEYYYDISKTYWLKDYIKLIENKFSFDIITKKNNIGSTKKEIYDLILSKFFSYKFFLVSLKKYIYEHQEQWENIESHYGKIKNYIYEKLIEILNN